MNILFISDKYKLFGESDSGASNRSTMFIRSLAQFAQVDVVSFTKVCDSNIPNVEVIYSTDYPKNTGNSKEINSLLLKVKRNLSKAVSSNILDFYKVNNEKTQLIQNFLGKKKYDFIACRYIDVAVSCSLFKYSNKLIIDVDDSPKQAFQVGVNAYFSGAGSLENILKRYLKRFYFKVLANSIERSTKKILSQVFCSFYSNPTEKPSDKSVFLHNVTISTTSIEDLPKDFTPIILMVGWMVYSPNKLGAIHFARKVFPLIKEKIPDAQFRIAGKYEGTFKDDLECNEGVKVLGFVPNIDEEYTNSAIVVVPIYQGSGTSIKVIEALQKNRPVVSTAMGIRGLENILIDGEDYLEADSDEQFARIIIKLLKSDPTKLISLAHNGNSKARKYFSQEKFIKIVNQTVLRK